MLLDELFGRLLKVGLPTLAIPKLSGQLAISGIEKAVEMGRPGVTSIAASLLRQHSSTPWSPSSTDSLLQTAIPSIAKFNWPEASPPSTKQLPLRFTPTQAVASQIEGMFGESMQPQPFDMDRWGSPRGSTSSSGQQQYITVNINALDSRSLLDRSDDIADALRQAVLNSHPLGDML